MKLENRLTKDHEYHPVAGVTTVSGYKDRRASAIYQPRTLYKWAKQAEDVDGYLHVSIQPTQMVNGEIKNCLVARVENSNVVVFAAPMLKEEEEGIL